MICCRRVLISVDQFKSLLLEWDAHVVNDLPIDSVCSCESKQKHGMANELLAVTSYCFRFFTASTSGVNWPGCRIAFCCCFFWNIKIYYGTFVYSKEIKFSVFHVSIHFCAYVVQAYVLLPIQVLYPTFLCQLSMLKLSYILSLSKLTLSSRFSLFTCFLYKLSTNIILSFLSFNVS